jgi:hypothetical protein
MSDVLLQSAADIGHVGKGKRPNQRTHMVWTHFYETRLGG